MATTPTTNTPTPEPTRSAPRPPMASVASGGSQGGSGVQRAHLRNRKQWLRERDRRGMSWMARKVASKNYCASSVERR